MVEVLLYQVVEEHHQDPIPDNLAVHPLIQGHAVIVIGVMPQALVTGRGVWANFFLPVNFDDSPP